MQLDKIFSIIFFLVVYQLVYSQNNNDMKTLKFEDYILGDTSSTSFYYTKGEGKTEFENILLQCFINNQGIRNNQFFSDKHVLVEKHKINEKGYKHYWNNNLTNDFSIWEIDNNNTNALKDIIKKHGFPNYDQLEDITRKAIFVIMFYSNDQQLLKQNIRDFKEKIIDKGFPVKYYAYLVDKLNFLEGKPQTYGTFFIIDDDYIKQPIEIEYIEELDKRRNSLGLENYEVWKETKEFEELGERQILRDIWYKQKEAATNM